MGLSRCRVGAVSPGSFDDLARNLASPMPRRSALRMLAAGVVVATVPGMTARRARAADQPKPCSGAGAGEFCGNVNPLGKIGYNIGCCRGGPNERNTVCCPGIPGTVGSLCCPPGYICGNTSANAKENCKCPSGVVCGDTCCNRGEYCETFLGFDSFCTRFCPGGNKKCSGGVCCTGLETCGFFGCSCKSGLVSCGTGLCCNPKKDPGDPNPGYNPFRNMFNMMGQSSAASGGRSSRRAMLVRSDRSGSAAVDAALDALAAVNGQGAAAMLAIRDGKRDPAFKQKVTVARATPPKLSADAVLNARSVAALNKLLVAEAEAYALIAAMAKALWRARAAEAKQNSAAAGSQLRASATFAGQAVTALKHIQALRTAAAKALKAGKVAEVWAFDDGVKAFIAAVRSGGIPASLRTPMGKLGVGSVDLKRLRAGVLDQTVTSAVGPALIAPLEDPARAKDLKSLISELSKYAARARKHPIAR
jgi:hypothetical protein